MLIKSIQEDVLLSDEKHIAFAINKEGYNDAGFSGEISKLFWNGLDKCGEHELGTVLSKKGGDKTFHALVCYSLKDGWGDNQKEIVQKCFDKIESNGEEISTIPIGTGFVGRMTGANFKDILRGMQNSKQKIILHSKHNSYNLKKMLSEEPNNKLLIKKNMS